MQLVQLKRTKIVFCNLFRCIEKNYPIFKTFFDMAKVFPSLSLLLISDVALRCLQSKLYYNACYFFFPSILFNSLRVSIYAFSADLIVRSSCFPIVSATSFFQAFIVHRKAFSDVFIQPLCCPLTELSCNLGFYSVS